MSARNSVIDTLDPGAYCGFLEQVALGVDAKTHKALVRFHGTTHPVDSFVKLYSQSAAPKGLINEIIGYSIGHRTSLHVAPRAGIISLTPSQAAFLPADFDAQEDADGNIVAWCVASIGGGNPFQIYNFPHAGALDLLREDICKWKQLPDVVSLDAWLLNEDRNVGNFVRIAAGKYAIIDHGRVCTGNSWQPPLDHQRMAHMNMASFIAWGCGLEAVPNAVRPAIVGACASHPAILQESQIDLDYWLAIFLDPTEEQDANSFLQSRATAVSAYLCKTYGMIL